MIKRFARRILYEILILLARITGSWRGRIPVFVYHSIDNSGSVLSTPPEIFDAHLSYLRAHGFPILSAGQALTARSGVAITFDDAYETIVPFVRAICARGEQTTVFAPSGLLGQTNRWDANRAHIPQLPIMSAQTLKTLGCEIGAHTRTHPRLPDVSDARLEDELTTPRRDLQTDFLAYPYGEVDSRVIKAAQQAGYRAAFATHLGYLTSETDRMNIPRFPANLDFLQFRLVIHGGYTWYRAIQNHLFGANIVAHQNP